ncbi:hypothetical protein ABEF92_003310 [Exophiala dermatitidis]|uniref:Enoyl-CoA hydratase n=1 Tax=Exophiala dermatitidis (strain ATCC 34100 / CBS 525.76 / NIH/UT8656) TaxID=858893 RepID=H6BKT5_EXODN|nr:enoyl-CoA hydratase [Exophiala dermatitidis NIH/UT8656]EHY52719.1 enoyl-CoA hydratase [Exophiala dermatitidis NIH/UT8656]
MTASSSIQISTSPKGIMTITINRPQRRNAVDPTTARDLYNAFRTFEQDSTQKVAILTGAEGTFCAGADLVALTEQSEDLRRQTEDARPKAGDTESDSNTDKSAYTYTRHLEPVADRNIGPMGPSRLIVQKPVIAAIAGYAVAGGLELSLMADLRVVEEDAVLGVFCRRFGVPLIDGGTVRLQAIVGLGRALDMILTGRPVSANEALAMGLANRVVPRGKALDEAVKLAESLLKFPNECMIVDRRSAYYAAFEARGWQDALRYEFDNGRGVVEREGVRGAERFARGKVGRHGSKL